VTAVRTDDTSRMLRFPWKGPASAPFGFEVRFPVVGLFLGFTLAGWVLVAFLAPNFGLGFLAAVAVPLAAIWATRRIAPHLTPDTPLGYYLEVARHEYRTPRPPRPARRHTR
jgi:hypothetical protein